MMEGQTNWTCTNDNGESLDYGTFDTDIDGAFYSSKLEIDFSRESQTDDTKDQEGHRTYKSQVTRRVEFETAYNTNANKEVHFPTYDEVDGPTAVDKQKRKSLYVLYFIGFLLVVVGISLIVVGLTSNSENHSGKIN
jgi:hypothetical protein